MFRGIWELPGERGTGESSHTILMGLFSGTMHDQNAILEVLKRICRDRCCCSLRQTDSVVEGPKRVVVGCRGPHLPYNRGNTRLVRASTARRWGSQCSRQSEEKSFGFYHATQPSTGWSRLESSWWSITEIYPSESVWKRQFVFRWIYRSRVGEIPLVALSYRLTQNRSLVAIFLRTRPT